jgi:hypothetical protein
MAGCQSFSASKADQPQTCRPARRSRSFDHLLASWGADATQAAQAGEQGEAVSHRRDCIVPMDVQAKFMGRSAR